MTDEASTFWATPGLISRGNGHGGASDEERPGFKVPCPSCQGHGYLIDRLDGDVYCCVVEVAGPCQTCLGGGWVIVS